MCARSIPGPTLAEPLRHCLVPVLDQLERGDDARIGNRFQQVKTVLGVDVEHRTPPVGRVAVLEEKPWGAELEPRSDIDGEVLAPGAVIEPGSG